MKFVKTFSAAALMAAAQLAAADAADDPLLAKLLVEELEWDPTAGLEAVTWGAHAWIGRDLNKIWLKTEGERSETDTEAASAELLYGRAVAPYWDAQVGWRRDFAPGDSQDRLALSLMGVAPYFFETELSAFVDTDGNVELVLATERELMLTQKLVLAPELEVSANTASQPEWGRGSGIANVELGLRLRYEIKRELAPYVGYAWEKSFGETADWQEAAGEHTEESHWVVGVRAWF